MDGFELLFYCSGYRPLNPTHIFPAQKKFCFQVLIIAFVNGLFAASHGPSHHLHFPAPPIKVLAPPINIDFQSQTLGTIYVLLFLQWESQ